MKPITKTVLLALIREYSDCTVHESEQALEKIASELGLMTRRDKFIAAVLQGIQSIPDSPENRRLSATWAVDIADAAMNKADGKETSEKI